MTTAGRRNRLITIERAGPEIDDGYTRQPGAYVLFARAWAEVLFGTGEERRQAAQENASQVATFKVLANPMTKQVSPSDRIQAFGVAWDITSAIPVGNAEIHITATRKA